MNSPRRPVPIRLQVVALTLGHTVMSTGYRMVYPFLPAIARGLGVDLRAMSLAVSARSSLGLFGPLFGSLADTWSRKKALLVSFTILAVAMTLVVAWPVYPALVVALLLAATAWIIMQAGLKAYLGDTIEYKQRGAVVAITEFGWSWAFLFGVPVVGWLIARSGWVAPFRLIAVLAAVAFAGIWFVIPSSSGRVEGRRPSMWAGLRALLRSRSAVGVMAFAFVGSGANELVNIVYGAWMESAFGLRVAALGLASAVIGVAELGGEVLVATVTDRIGKRRSVALGLTINALACLGLGTFARSLPLALVGLFLLYITFEFTVVSAISLMTEQVPEARATSMASYAASAAAGRAIGALIGPVLFTWGIAANGLATALADGVALLVLVLFVRDRAASS
jgi:MFS transporter, DHA1 family, inner membrane transport protein